MLSIKKIISKIYRLTIPIKAMRVRKKRVIKVSFIFSNVSFWKNDALYLKMLEHPRFNPSIIIVPDLMIHGDAQNVILSCETYLKEKGYKFYSPFTKCSDANILSIERPDIIFYPRPYNAYPDTYRYENNYYSLFCHSDYGYHSVKNSYIIDTAYINHVWQNYCENDSVKGEVLKEYPNLKNSIVVTGLPNTDSFLNSTISPWKICEGVKYKIIWAPHFSVEPGWLDYSNFLEISEGMLKLMKESKLTIQWAFKPHPLLKSTLYKHPQWGKFRTDKYYAEWSQASNSQLEEGDYIGLFMNSDAMIHDCSSFRIEFLHTGKPALFLSKDKGNCKENLFKVGYDALECHYIGQTIEDVKWFINDVVVKKNDPKEVDRINYFKKYLLPPYDNSASENIINAILGE